MENNSKTTHKDSDDEEEALSLCDLPLHSPDELNWQALDLHRPNSSSEPAEFFEFFSDNSFDTCPAEDIIVCGKLVPFKNSSASYQRQAQSSTFSRRSDSLNESQTSESTRNRFLRTSRSLDYQKLHGSSLNRDTDRRLVRKGSVGSSTQTKFSKWYLFFGSVKVPSGMELREIKSRQIRRSPSSMFSTSTASHGGREKGTWWLLKALSCKDHASVAVTTSFGCMSRA